jgi:lipopolysaccharide export system permease protein
MLSFLSRLTPKTIHRAIFKELFVAFIGSLLSLNFSLLMEKFFRLSRLLSGVGASVPDMVKIILLIQPQLMILTIPMSLLLSVLLTYGRLNGDNELTALKTAGMTFREAVQPVFLLGLICFLAGIVVSFSISPSSAVALRESISKILMQRAPLAIEAGIFNTFFKDVVILVRAKPSPDRMEGIFIYDSRNKNEPKVLVAREGRVNVGREYELALFMKDGYIHIAKPEGSIEISFKGYNLSLSLVSEGPSRKNSEMTPGELLREAESKEKKERISLLLEFHRRLSLPSLCLLLMFLGPPLSLLSGKSGRLGGLTIGLGIFVLFYTTLVYSENVVRSGYLSHYTGAWLPVVLIGVASIWSFMKAGSR